MDRFLLDASGGIITTVYHDEMADRTFLKETQDVEPYLKRNAYGRNHTDGYTPSKDLRKVAEIPFVCIGLWKQIYGVDYLRLRGSEKRAFLRRVLNDPDLKNLRASPGAF